MATLAIGDVQGCYDQLMRLLERARYDDSSDVLWFVGDLVNRGPQSARVLRFAKSLGRRQVTVLGNHDLALLVVASGAKKPHRGDTFDELLAAPDREELIDWLRRQKMMHAEGAYAMVHAGLLPGWSLEKALALATEVEAVLQGPDPASFLRQMYGNEPVRWHDGLAGYDRLRVIVNAMSRLRLVTPDGAMEFGHKTGLATLPAGYVPWYDAPARASRDARIVFGHWAALGLMRREDVVCLDTGCVWGRALSAMRLEDGALFQIDCPELAGTAAED